jgi:ribosomal protein S18 acetylase RimI-like enzyme
MQFTLRQCTDSDRDWAYALKREAYLEVVERQFGPWDEEKQRRMFSERWNPAISRIILVDDAAVGLVATEERPDELWIDEIQLTADWQGKGFGTAVLLDLLSRAKEARKPVRLRVLLENPRARRLYERLGFCVTGQTATHHLMEHRGGVADDSR